MKVKPGEAPPAPTEAPPEKEAVVEVVAPPPPPEPPAPPPRPVRVDTVDPAPPCVRPDLWVDWPAERRAFYRKQLEEEAAREREAAHRKEAGEDLDGSGGSTRSSGLPPGQGPPRAGG
jgi:hypothetical protein